MSHEAVAEDEKDDSSAPHLDLQIYNIQEILANADFTKIEDLEKIFGLLEDIKKNPQEYNGVLLTNAQEKQMETLAYALFIAYRDGQEAGATSHGWTPDKEKANFYLAKILITASPENIIDNTLFWFTWLTTVRLAFMRVFDREYTSSLSFLPQTFFNRFPSMVASNFNLFQFSYGPELLFCLIKLISESFRPKTEEDKDKWFYERFESKRFSQIFFSRKFFGAFSNAFVWLVVNIVTYHVYTPLACAINLGGFTFDVFHDGYLAHQEKKEYRKLQENHALCEEYGLQDQLNNKIKALAFKRNYAIGVAIGILFGMLIFYAPVLMPALPGWLSASTAWYGAVIAVGLRHLPFLKWLGASVVMCSAVGLSFIWGRLNTFLTKNFYKELWDFLKKYKAESIITAGLVVGTFALKIFFPASIFAGVLTFGIPAVTALTFLAVKAISYVWHQRQEKQSNSSILEEWEKHTLMDALKKSQYKVLLEEKPGENRNNIANTCNMLRVFQSLLLADGKDEEKKVRRDLILHASQLSSEELNKHLRNWGRENTEILKYKTPQEFFKQLEITAFLPVQNYSSREITMLFDRLYHSLAEQKDNIETLINNLYPSFLEMKEEYEKKLKERNQKETTKENPYTLKEYELELQKRENEAKGSLDPARLKQLTSYELRLFRTVTGLLEHSEWEKHEAIWEGRVQEQGQDVSPDQHFINFVMEKIGNDVHTKKEEKIKKWNDEITNKIAQKEVIKRLTTTAEKTSTHFASLYSTPPNLRVFCKKPAEQHLGTRRQSSIGEVTRSPRLLPCEATSAGASPPSL
ncbi:MAG: hypothetical protein K0R24_861 [Gammaproteobacteria bacterium]|jgi:hypothetical protein|nr:hypothetical protein [Gammaproteobacteria bacterium]